MRFNPRLSVLLSLLLCVIAALGQFCFAQTFSASIAGVVTDPSGSVVPKAKMQLRNMDTNGTRDAIATEAGTYKFDNLLPGTVRTEGGGAGLQDFRSQQHDPEGDHRRDR